MEGDQLSNLFATHLGLSQQKAKETTTNKQLSQQLVDAITICQQVQSYAPDANRGKLIYNLVSRVPPSAYQHVPQTLKLIACDKINQQLQIEVAVEFLRSKANINAPLDQNLLETECGVGVVVSEQDIKKQVDILIENNKAAILKAKNKNKFIGQFMKDVKTVLKWANPQTTKKILDESLDAVLNSGEQAPVEKPQEEKKKEQKQEEEEDIEQLKAKSKDKLAQCVGRELKSLVNSPELLQMHKEKTGGKIVTRFPPEPNGYLHIGHAKAMRFNFTVAENAGGVCYLRFDDTNPEKENMEFINSIKSSVQWLGYKPYQVTHASEYFQDLYNYAVQLIKQGQAYCDLTPADKIKLERKEGIESKYRNTSVEWNLEQFEKMRQGFFNEGECCLRMKIDMKNENPCMRDPVAYRIKYVPHPHVGDKWCVYPTYDFTHCLNDSLEFITHSLCTLEFEIRRDSYYWLLEALNVWRPMVWEYSRLNITYTVLSKRKLTQLVSEGKVKGWDDPRMPTLDGLKRRGYTPESINDFVDIGGVTRRGNSNILSIKLLEHCIRKDLDNKAPRTMAVIEPLKIIIQNQQTQMFWVPDYPAEFMKKYLDEQKDKKDKQEFQQYFEEIQEQIRKNQLTTENMHSVFLSNEVFIDQSDFQEEAAKDFFGLVPGGKVQLKYGPIIKYISHERNPDGSLKHVVAESLPVNEKLKGIIHWVSASHCQNVEVRLYDTLFNVEDPMSLPEPFSALNPDSVIIKVGKVDSNIVNRANVGDRFQFERVGYFIVDKDSVPGRIVFNRTVTLKESKSKTKTGGKKK